ncbi:trehalose phosphatase, putative [Babesia caballi]|uniref:Trehalose phosphatase, putative n=1 Tax=Babesia caballi TaxID=5871 RepID=A0AAV4LPI3_BABCB|nr:trehalose phosphatase, putative [Babesia caballi]
MKGVASEEAVEPRGDAAGTGVLQGGKRSDGCVLSTQRSLVRRRMARCEAPGVSVDDVPAAGLSSERCTRDFAARCNLLWYSGAKRTQRPMHSTTYEDVRKQPIIWNKCHRYGDRAPLQQCGEPMPSDTVSSRQMKLRAQYAKYNKTGRVVSEAEPRLKTTSAPMTDREVNRLRGMRHCRIFLDTDDSHESSPQPESQTADTHDHVTTDQTNLLPSGEERLSNTDCFVQSASQSTETTIIGGVRTVTVSVPEWEVVTMRMSCIDPLVKEHEVQELARMADMQIVTLSLDRNIISHLCNGTGTIKCRHTGGESGLLRFSQLLARRGIRLYITDLISHSDMTRVRPSK